MELHFKPGSRILELGGSNHPLKDNEGNRASFNMDLVSGENVDLVWDISNTPWPFEDKSFDGIFSAYCIEHIEWRKISSFLKECNRVLRPNGKIIAFVPNTYEQCKLVIEKGINTKTIETLFGSQEYPNYGGVHKTGFSPEYIKQTFDEAGLIVRTHEHPDSKTDLVIEAYKINQNEIFERSYFDGEIGYSGLGYRDFATHYSTARIILQTGAKSVIDIGAGRGYIVKLLENEGIRAIGIDISKHCYHTRATDNFILWDATKTPWPSVEGDIHAYIPDKFFELAFSINFLEHIPEDKIDDVIRESIRVSKGGLHGIHLDKSPFQELDLDQDITHCTLHSLEWWYDKFKKIDPNYTVIIKHPRYIEYEKPEKQPPVTVMPKYDDKKIKLNLGSFTNMFYYGWKNIDIIDLKNFADSQKYNFVQYDLTKGLPYGENNVDMIISNHLIEHLTREEGKKLLKECYRVLKPGGIIRISTPDTEVITKKYLEGNIWEYKYVNIGVENAHDEAEAYYNLLLAGHKTIYDRYALGSLLKDVGFKLLPSITPFTSQNETMRKETITSHPTISLIIEAEK